MCYLSGANVRNYAIIAKRIIDKDNKCFEKTQSHREAERVRRLSSIHALRLHGSVIKSRNGYNYIAFSFLFARFTVFSAGTRGKSFRLNAERIFAIFFNPILLPFFSNSLRKMVIFS